MVALASKIMNVKQRTVRLDPAEVNNKDNRVRLMKIAMLNWPVKLSQRGLSLQYARALAYMEMLVNQITTATQKLTAGINILLMSFLTSNDASISSLKKQEPTLDGFH